jgi:hypothetical protein
MCLRAYLGGITHPQKQKKSAADVISTRVIYAGLIWFADIAFYHVMFNNTVKVRGWWIGDDVRQFVRIIANSLRKFQGDNTLEVTPLR